MSGSGGGNGGGGPITPDDALDCAKLFDRTVLNSPDAKVLKSIKIGDRLGITVSSSRVIQAVTEAGEIAGSITSMRMLQFIECIEKGFNYIAVVKGLTGGRCEVEIRPEGI